MQKVADWTPAIGPHRGKLAHLVRIGLPSVLLRPTVKAEHQILSLVHSVIFHPIQVGLDFPVEAFVFEAALRYENVIIVRYFSMGH